MRTPLLALSLLVTTMAASPAVAGPKVAAPAGKSTSDSVFRGGPSDGEPQAEGSATKAPSAAERTHVAKSLAGRQVAIAQAPWASVGVRSPFVRDRAALVFVAAARVDPMSGWARLPGASGATLDLAQGPMIPDLGQLFADAAARDGNGAPGHGVELWIHARPGHEYVATCRVRLKSAAGDVTMRGADGFRLTTKVDHRGKPSGQVSFLVDPAREGWYGFSIDAAQTWFTTGCWVDESERRAHS